MEEEEAQGSSMLEVLHSRDVMRQAHCLILFNTLNPNPAKLLRRLSLWASQWFAVLLYQLD